jgi:hypothetical protein
MIRLKGSNIHTVWLRQDCLPVDRQSSRLHVSSTFHLYLSRLLTQAVYLGLTWRLLEEMACYCLSPVFYSINQARYISL